MPLQCQVLQFQAICEVIAYWKTIRNFITKIFLNLIHVELSEKLSKRLKFERWKQRYVNKIIEISGCFRKKIVTANIVVICKMLLKIWTIYSLNQIARIIFFKINFIPSYKSCKFRSLKSFCMYREIERKYSNYW